MGGVSLAQLAALAEFQASHQVTMPTALMPQRSAGTATTAAQAAAHKQRGAPAHGHGAQSASRGAGAVGRERGGQRGVGAGLKLLAVASASRAVNSTGGMALK